jgi:RNA polymerase sigma factor (sigma-70 family)
MYLLSSEVRRIKMLTEQEAHDLMTKLLDLRAQFKETGDLKIEARLKRHEHECIEKFRYLVTMKTGRYKAFSNYEDLNQVGFEALIKAMKTFKPNKGNFFAWAHNYIGTSISRNANLHTTIRFPLKVAKAHTPHKESVMPVQIEERYCPDKELEECQTTYAVQNALASLTKEQREIVSLAYGFDGDKPMSINKICKKLNVSRLSCIKTINSALSIMKEKIKI